MPNDSNRLGQGADGSFFAELLAGIRPAGAVGLPRALASPLPGSQNDPYSAIASALESARRRSGWNERFEHWERPASISETGTIERADAIVSDIVANNGWLTGQRVTVARQGSYHNNTNVRTEADIDIRVVHPTVLVEYSSNVIDPVGWQSAAYLPPALNNNQIFAGLRTNLAMDFRRRFGDVNVEVGNKAIRIKGVTGSRAEIDVVPAVPLHFVSWSDAGGNFNTLEGVAILGRDGLWTWNFPEQHATKGRTKRVRTAHRFKKVVRVFKRLRADMAERGLLHVKVPSFLVECLVYAVEDAYFLVESDDRYERVKRVAHRMHAMVSDPQIAARMLEINEIKLLFHEVQAWDYGDAVAFVNSVVMHLGDI